MDEESYRFEVEGVPVPKPRMTQRDKWAQRPQVVRYRTFENAVLAAAIEAKMAKGRHLGYTMSGYVEVFVRFAKEKTVIEVRPAADCLNKPLRGDLDNYVKSILEGLQGEYGLIEDDRQVVRLAAEFDMFHPPPAPRTDDC